MAGTGNPDIALDYDTILNVSKKLSYAHDNISPQIISLQSAVDSLLSQDGGLWMDSTSPAIQGQYQQFNSSATQVVQAIDSFSQLFSKFVQQMQSMDLTYATQINNPSSS